MFCSKCGTKSIEGSAFCQKCGAKLATGETPIGKSAEPIQAASMPSMQQPAIAPKKKSKKLLFGIIGVAIAAIVAIVIALNSGDKTDYVLTVKAHKPFVSQGLSHTYGTVLNDYIASPIWETHKVNNETDVNIRGKVKSTGDVILVSINVTSDRKNPDMVSISPASVTIGDKRTGSPDEAVRALLDIFYDYDEGQTGAPTASQSQTTFKAYTNTEHGFSFKYPSDWIDGGSQSVTEIIRVYDGYGMVFSVHENYVLPFELDSGDEAIIKEAVNAFHEFVSVDDAVVNGRPMRELIYKSKNLVSKAIYVDNYFYFVGDNNYQISVELPIDTLDNYQAIFEAIMDSYTITNAGGSSGTETKAANQHPGEVSFNGVPISTLFGMSINEAIAALGTSANIDENRLYFDGIEFRLENEKIVSAESFEPGKLTFDGVSLDKSRAELVSILGDPSWESMGGSGHELTFELGSYSLVIATGDVDGTAWRISLYPIKQTSQGTTTLPELPHGWTWTTQTITSDGVKITMDLPSEWKLIEDVQPWGSSIGVADIGEPFLWIGDVFEGMGSTEKLVASGRSSQEFMFDNMGAGYRIEFDNSTVMWVPMDSWLGITFSQESHKGIYLAYSEIIEAVARSFNWSSN